MELITLFQKIYDLSKGEAANGTSFFLVMVLLYLNILLYLIDLYTLVKKKTPGETVMIMLLPGTITIIGAVMFSIYLQIPETADLDGVWAEAVSPRLWTELLCLAGSFVFLWCLVRLLWKKSRENQTGAVQCILSYGLDFFIAILLAAVGGTGLAGGTDLLIPAGRLTPRLGYNLVLYLFLYGTTALAFKIALLLLAGLTQICSVRISHFPYQENRNPTISFLLYAVLFQNARVRGALAFWSPMLCFAVWLISAADIFMLRVMFPIFIVLAFALYLLLALRPIADNMARFAQWGDRKQILSMFCREYFLEEPIMKTKDFTVTRHFLADERGMIEVFAFDAAAELSGGWVSDPKKGWVRQLSFLDGGCCTICKDDMGADEIFRYAKQYHEMQQLTGSGRTQRRQQPAAPGESLYHKLLYFVIAALVMLLLIMPRMM